MPQESRRRRDASPRVSRRRDGGRRPRPKHGGASRRHDLRLHLERDGGIGRGDPPRRRREDSKARPSPCSGASSRGRREALRTLHPGGRSLLRRGRDAASRGEDRGRSGRGGTSPAGERFRGRPEGPGRERAIPGRRLFTPPHLAYLKISDGCANRCSYCMIPVDQGRSREPVAERDPRGGVRCSRRPA